MDKLFSFDIQPSSHKFSVDLTRYMNLYFGKQIDLYPNVMSPFTRNFKLNSLEMNKTSNDFEESLFDNTKNSFVKDLIRVKIYNQ